MMRKILWTLGGLVVAILVMDNFVMPIFVRRGQEFPLPDVTAMQEDEARSELEDLGLTLEVSGQEFSPASLEGTILSQVPMAGTMVKSGRPVEVVISKGSQMVRVPYLAGVTVRQATLTLSDAGLVPGDIDWTYSDSLPPEVVIATTPEAGGLLAKGSRVRLLVNQGGEEESVAMPNLVGEQVGAAASTLDSLGLELGVVIRQQSKDLLPGTVLEQSEPAGDTVKRGEVVDLVVAAAEGDA